MTSRGFINFFVVFVLGLAISGTVSAQGVIIPRPCDISRRCPRPIPPPVRLPSALPVKSIVIDAKINRQVVTTRIEQVFENDSPYILEGTYFFPIPEDASVEQFAIWENGKKLVGEVRSREEARKIYDSIVRSMKDPGLLEYAGKDLFQASIFPIPANSDKKLELTYSQVLKAESGTVGYRYPLGTGRNLWANRGRWFAERGGSDRMPEKQKFGTVSGTIEISSNEAIRNIYSPSHKVEVSKKSEKSATVSFETKSDPSDFQLFYGLSNNDFGMSLMTYREPGKDGYFLLMLSPRADIDDEDLADKDIVFVLDTSGSMADEGKIDKAKSALLFGINGLRAGDRFNVINFAGEEHLMESGLITADSDGKAKGRQFVEKLTPNGGTNINDALASSLRQFDNTERPKMLVFLTDGLPTVGETDIDRIITNSKKVSVKNLRVFPFGVGYDVNTRLLDKLAAENSGVADYVEPKEDLEIKVSNFFTKVNSPVLTNIAFDFGSLRPDLMYPRQFTDIFKGTQLVVVGRYKNSSDLENISFELKGKAGSRDRTYRYNNLSFPLRSTENEFLPRIWAIRRVGWLVEQIRSNGDNKELRDEIVELGTRYGIVTPYTSYLATDGTERDAAISGNRAFRNNAPMPIASVGAGAVADSKKSRSQQYETQVDAESDELLRKSVGKDGSATAKRVGTKTFYLKEDTWFDSEFKEADRLPEITLTFASNAYFELVNKDREISKYLAIGKKLVLVWKGRVYRIIE